MKELLTWEALEYEPKTHSLDWFYAVGIIAFALITTALIYQNILLAILLGIGIFALLFQSAKKPNMTNYEINEHGVVIGSVFYKYSSLASFDIPRNKQFRYVVIELKSGFVPHIKIPIPSDIEKHSVFQLLNKHLPEKTYQESFSEILMDRLGF